MPLQRSPFNFATLLVSYNPRVLLPTVWVLFAGTILWLALPYHGPGPVWSHHDASPGMKAAESSQPCKKHTLTNTDEEVETVLATVGSEKDSRSPTLPQIIASLSKPGSAKVSPGFEPAPLVG